MQLSHDPARVSVVFDDPNLVSCAGLAPVVALAGRAGLDDLVTQTLTVPGKAGANAAVKVGALVAGMLIRERPTRLHPPILTDHATQTSETRPSRP